MAYKIRHHPEHSYLVNHAGQTVARFPSIFEQGSYVTDGDKVVMAYAVETHTILEQLIDALEWGEADERASAIQRARMHLNDIRMETQRATHHARDVSSRC